MIFASRFAPCAHAVAVWINRPVAHVLARLSFPPFPSIRGRRPDSGDSKGAAVFARGNAILFAVVVALGSRRSFV